MTTEDSLVHGLSGGIGTVLSTCTLYPLETARTRIQVEDRDVNSHALAYILKIYKEEGFVGVYRGWQSVTLSTFATCAIYFYIFHWLKGSSCVGANVRNQSLCNDLLFGCYAGITAVLITNPLWVINTRLKLQGANIASRFMKNAKQPRYFGIYDCLWKIVKHEGVIALWTGLLPSLILVCNPAIQFMVYEVLKRHTLLLMETQDLSALAAFVYGAMSKAVATVTTYPLQVIQTRVRAGTNVWPEHCQLFSFAALAHFFRGLETKLTHTALNSALMFLFYEKIKLIIAAGFTKFGH